jgi:2-oxoisovalerate dehydrogenase E1 component
VTELDAPTAGRAHDEPAADEMRALYRALLLPRVIEDKMLALLRRGQLSKWFSGIGQEAVSVGLVAALRADDWILPAHRNLGVFTGRGLDLDVLFRQLLGREGPITGGRDRTFHFGDLEHHVVGMISHLGAMVPVATGLALAARLRGEDRVAAVLTGDGASSEGDVHEAMNLAAVWRLPVLFVIENNQWGLSTPVSEQYACVDLVDRAAGYGMPGELVDGNDVLAVRDACERAAARGRAGEGPTLLECKTFRMRGHEEASVNDYVPAADLAAWVTRDPIDRFEARLDEAGLLPATERAALREELRVEVETLVSGALAAPAPATTEDEELGRVYAARAPLRRTDAGSGASGADDMRYLDAVRDALRVGWPPTTGSCCSARTSPATAACSRRRRAWPTSSAPSGCATRRSSSPGRWARRWAWRSTASGPWSRCSSAISSPPASTR